MTLDRRNVLTLGSESVEESDFSDTNFYELECFVYARQDNGHLTEKKCKIRNVKIDLILPAVAVLVVQ